MTDDHVKEIFNEMKTLPLEKRREIEDEFGWESPEESMAALKAMGEDDWKEMDEWLGIKDGESDVEMRESQRKPNREKTVRRSLALQIMGGALAVFFVFNDLVVSGASILAATIGTKRSAERRTDNRQGQFEKVGWSFEETSWARACGL